MAISMHNLTERINAEKSHGHLRENTCDLICAHILLWKRFQCGTEPTPEEVADEQFKERMRQLEAAPKEAASPPRFTSNPVIGINCFC